MATTTPTPIGKHKRGIDLPEVDTVPATEAMTESLRALAVALEPKKLVPGRDRRKAVSREGSADTLRAVGD